MNRVSLDTPPEVPNKHTPVVLPCLFVSLLIGGSEKGQERTITTFILVASRVRLVVQEVSGKG